MSSVPYLGLTSMYACRRSLATFSRVLRSQNKSGSDEGASKPAAAASQPKPKKAAEPSSKKSKQQQQPPPPAVEEFRNDRYSTPEYYEHNKFSYNDINLSMASLRCPQKSNKQSY